MSQGYTPSLGEDPDRFLGFCRGKVRHPSKRRARAALTRLLRLGQVPNPEWMEIFHCKACKKWHMGHNYARRPVRPEES